MCRAHLNWMKDETHKHAFDLSTNTRILTKTKPCWSCVVRSITWYFRCMYFSILSIVSGVKALVKLSSNTKELSIVCNNTCCHCTCLYIKSFYMNICIPLLFCKIWNNTSIKLNMFSLIYSVFTSMFYNNIVYKTAHNVPAMSLVNQTGFVRL